MLKILGAAAASASLVMLGVTPATAEATGGALSIQEISHVGEDSSFLVQYNVDGVGKAIGVTLQRKDNDSWVDMVSLTTDATGAGFFDYVDSTHSQVFRLALTNDKSDTSFTVNVAQADLTFPTIAFPTKGDSRSGNTVKLQAKVTYQTYTFPGGQFYGQSKTAVPAGLHVQLQRYESNKWVTVDTHEVQATSGSENLFFTETAPKSQWRLNYPGSSAYAATATAPVSL